MGIFSTISLARSWPVFLQIDGEWLVWDDGIVRPVIRGEIIAANGSWVPVSCLLDTGADRIVFNDASLAALSAYAPSASERLSGLGAQSGLSVRNTRVLSP